MVTAQILKINNGACQFVRHEEVKINICVEFTFILEENKCVWCRINNLTLSMIRIKKMKAVNDIEPEKGKIAEDHI